MHSFIRSFIRSFIHSSVHSFVHSFIHSFIRSFIQLFIRSFIRSFIHFLFFCNCLNSRRKTITKEILLPSISNPLYSPPGDTDNTCNDTFTSPHSAGSTLARRDQQPRSHYSACGGPEPIVTCTTAYSPEPVVTCTTAYSNFASDEYDDENPPTLNGRATDLSVTSQSVVVQ